MKNDLTTLKTYLRIDDDMTEDDLLLDSLVESGKTYIESTTGKQYLNSDFLMNTLLLILVSHWYTNRNNNGKTTSTKEYDHTITAILNNIKYSNLYKEIPAND